MVIKKTSRMSLVEQVAEQIESLIEEGHWAVGEKIPPEMVLMEQFDVSRNTLREAIRALVHAGLLETKQGSGTIVRAENTLGVALERHAKKAAMIETLDVRFALEKQAAKLAAERFEEVDFTKMHATLEACQQAADKEDRVAFIQSDILFHSSIVEASGNQLLFDLYKPLFDVVYDFVEQMIELEKDLLHDNEFHIGLVRAIEAGNVEAAGAIVGKYFNELRGYVEKVEG